MIRCRGNAFRVTSCRMANPLRVIDATRSVIDEVERLISTARPPLLHDEQLHRAAASIAANIREAYGRRKGAEGNQFLRYARGSAEEADEHLRANFRAERIPAKRFWPLHNRLAVIVRMLTALMDNSREQPRVPKGS